MLAIKFLPLCLLVRIILWTTLFLKYDNTYINIIYYTKYIIYFNHRKIIYIYINVSYCSFYNFPTAANGGAAALPRDAVVEIMQLIRVNLNGRTDIASFTALSRASAVST